MEKCINACLIYQVVWGSRAWGVPRGTSYVKAPPMVGPTWTRVRLTLGSDCLPALFQGTIVMTPPMVGSTWPRVRSTLESDCLPALFQGTVSFRLVTD